MNKIALQLELTRLSLKCKQNSILSGSFIRTASDDPEEHKN
jgi:hypothetical protein